MTTIPRQRPSRAGQLYRRLFRLFPPVFRSDYEAAMRQHVADRLRDEQPAGRRALTLFWVAMCADLVKAAAHERIEDNMTTSRLTQYGGSLALLGGLLWAAATVAVAADVASFDGMITLVLLATVGIAACMVALALRPVMVSPRLSVAAAILGALGVANLVAGILTGGWWFAAGGVYSLLLGTVLLGLGMLNAARLPVWIALALVAAALLMIPTNAENWQMWLFAPFGLVWLTAGYMLRQQADDSVTLSPL